MRRPRPAATDEAGRDIRRSAPVHQPVGRAREHERRLDQSLPPAGGPETADMQPQGRRGVVRHGPTLDRAADPRTDFVPVLFIACGWQRGSHADFRSRYCCTMIEGVNGRVS